MRATLPRMRPCSCRRKGCAREACRSRQSQERGGLQQTQGPGRRDDLRCVRKTVYRHNTNQYLFAGVRKNPKEAHTEKGRYKTRPFRQNRQIKRRGPRRCATTSLFMSVPSFPAGSCLPPAFFRQSHPPGKCRFSLGPAGLLRELFSCTAFPSRMRIPPPP